MFVFKAAVVGAGAMGSEIAQVIAAAEIPVALVADSTGYGELGDADLVIEAAAQEMEAKQAIFSELDAVTPSHAILASTTSSPSITELGEASGRPDRVVGLHFFEPVAKIRLVEVVEGEDTSEQTARVASSFVQAIRKLPIRCAEAPGFVVNRILAASRADAGASSAAEPPKLDSVRALVESCLVIEEGVAAMKDVDLAMMAGAGIVPPPLQEADRAGLDEVLGRLERLATERGASYEAPTILRRLVAQGRLGVKAGQGFFGYPRPDPGWAQSPVKLETRRPIAIAWLDRPPANSLSPEVVQTLRRLWQEVAGDGGVRALVFASASPALFCAGADIKAFTTMDQSSGRQLLDDMHGLLRDMERSSVATIAAVNALAFGGGCELAMACDIRIAAESASFGQPEINLGIIPGFGGTQRLPRLVGEARALELNLTGEPISAEEACDLGLATRVVPDHELLDTALAWARKLAGQPPLAVQEIKRVSAAGDFDAGIEAEKEGFMTTFASEDAREGIDAFLHKRTARFQGR
jgi:enoyl-CoA hydratase / 3-hydroxyacyl-CoA dehydrogenase